MTTRTRRRVLVSLVVLALTLPAESILLKAVTAPNVKDAAKQYVSSLSASQLQRAAGTIEAFPYAYRRQIMAALTPDVRAKVWQNHVANYVATHPTLDPQAESLLEVLSGLVTPEFVSSPTAPERQQVGPLVAQIRQLVGNDAYAELFTQLGPKDLAITVSEPMVERLANYVRRGYELLADSDNDCDCSLSIGCDGGATHCQDGTGCAVDDSYPECGPFWMFSCDGKCQGGAPS